MSENINSEMEPTNWSEKWDDERAAAHDEYAALIAQQAIDGKDIPVSVINRLAVHLTNEQMDTFAGVKAKPTLKVYAKRPELFPTRKNGDSGFDVRADMQAESGVALHGGYRRLVKTGLYAAVPAGYEIQARPRSGLALKHGITVLNSPGTIDSTYRGEIGIVMQNHGHEPFIINDLDRIAQLVMMPIISINAIAVDSLEALGATERGSKGYGSSGIK